MGFTLHPQPLSASHGGVCTPLFPMLLGEGAPHNPRYCPATPRGLPAPLLRPGRGDPALPLPPSPSPSAQAGAASPGAAGPSPPPAPVPGATGLLCLRPRGGALQPPVLQPHIPRGSLATPEGGPCNLHPAVPHPEGVPSHPRGGSCSPQFCSPPLHPEEVPGHPRSLSPPRGHPQPPVLPPARRPLPSPRTRTPGSPRRGGAAARYKPPVPAAAALPVPP